MATSWTYTHSTQGRIVVGRLVFVGAGAGNLLASAFAVTGLDAVAPGLLDGTYEIKLFCVHAVVNGAGSMVVAIEDRVSGAVLTEVGGAAVGDTTTFCAPENVTGYNASGLEVRDLLAAAGAGTLHIFMYFQIPYGGT